MDVNVSKVNGIPVLKESHNLAERLYSSRFPCISVFQTISALAMDSDGFRDFAEGIRKPPCTNAQRLIVL